MKLIHLFLFLFIVCSTVIQSQNTDYKINEQAHSTADSIPLYQSLPADTFEKLLKDKLLIQLVDVRTPEEYMEEFIPYAINIDIYSEAFDQKSESILNHQLPVAVYCKGGIRSRKAADVLTKKGYTVYNLDKGFDDWKKTGKPFTSKR